MTTVASSISMIPQQLWNIFYFIVLPMLLLAGVGFLLQRRLGLDMPTLTKLNFYFVVPGMIYYSLVTSEVTAGAVAAVSVFTLGMLLAMAALTYLLAVLRGVPASYRSAMLMTTMFHNSGNYGLPLQDLSFRSAGLGGAAMSLQVFVMVVQNIVSFTVGVLIAAAGGSGGHNWRRNLMHVVKFPPIYVLPAALLTIRLRSALGESADGIAQALSPFWEALKYVKGAFIGIALCTLGAQLAVVRPAKADYPITLSVILRLLAGPAIALVVIFVAGLEGFLAQVLLIAMSTPTAVNSMLLCLQFDNHPDYAARAVFYSTLLSPLTVTIVIFLAQSGLLDRRPAMAGLGPARAVAAQQSAGDAQPATGAAAGGAAATQASTTRPDGSTRMSKRKTIVSVEGDAFRINGRPTYEGRTFNGMKVEGLLMNSRMVQGAFDDLNDKTRSMWDYPDGKWDPDRNTREFIAAMAEWRRHGLLAFTINLQGGSPQGYSKSQPWHNSAFRADGSLRDDYLRRLEQIIDKADELGMAVILGYFYFGQDERLADEQAVIKATENATDWLLKKGYANVMVEIANEINVKRYEHAILTPGRCHELIELVQKRSTGKAPSPAGRLMTGISMGGGGIPSDNIVAASDIILLHGNGVAQPDRIRKMVDTVRAMKSYRGQPILFNEDDHFDFDKPDNNMLAAVSRHASWGYFDYRMKGEGYDEGFQSVPVNWTISSARKKGFFGLLARLTGAQGN